MVIKKYRSIHWYDEAKFYFKQAIQYFKQESPQGAVTVRKAILDHLAILKSDAGIYESDKFKIANDGSYRAVTVYNSRITYKVTFSKVLVLRIRHTSQNPILY